MGAPPVAVGGYLVCSAVVSVLSHANLRLPRAMDRGIGMVVLTPEMHRTHHSIDVVDCNSNFGVCLSFWDRLFRTYRPWPMLGHQSIAFGVVGRTAGEATSLLRMLADPFLQAPVDTPRGAADRVVAGEVPTSRRT